MNCHVVQGSKKKVTIDVSFCKSRRRIFVVIDLYYIIIDIFIVGLVSVSILVIIVIIIIIIIISIIIIIIIIINVVVMALQST